MEDHKIRNSYIIKINNKDFKSKEKLKKMEEIDSGLTSVGIYERKEL